MKIDCAFMTTFTRPYPGREKKALDFAAESEEYWGKHAADGKCTPPEWFFAADKGIWMVKGERKVLEELALGETGLRLVTKGDFLLQDFTYELVATGSGADDFLTAYAAAGEDLGIL